MKARRMKEKEKKNKFNSKKILKILFILLLIIVISIAGYYIYQNIISNTQEKNLLLEDKDVFGMLLKNIEIEEKNGLYNFQAQVENTLKEKFEKQAVQIIFRDERDQKVVKYQYIIEDLEQGETQDIEIITSEPLNEFYTFEVKKII